MKKTCISLVFLVIIMVIFMGHGQFDRGYVLLVYHNVRIEMTVWMALLLWLLITLVVGGSVGLLRRLLRWPRTWRKGRLSRRSACLNKNRKEALRCLLLGNYKRAKRYLSRDFDRTDPLSWINSLALTQIAYTMEGDIKAGNLSVEQLIATDFKHDPLLMYLFKARCQWQAGKYHHVVDTLIQAQALGFHHPRVWWWLQKAYRSLNDQKALQAILMSHWHACSSWMSDDEQQACMTQVGPYSLQKASSVRQLHEIWKQLPASWREQADLIRCYAQALDQQGETSQAACILQKQVKFDRQAAVLYARLKHENLAQALVVGETWLSRYADSVEILLCVTLLSARQSWWGKAFDYAKICVQKTNDAEILYELASWFETMNKMPEALGCYRKAMTQIFQNSKR